MPSRLRADHGETAVLDAFSLTGGPFGAEGRIAVDGKGLSQARFGSLRLNEGDSVSVDVRREGAGYAVDVEGQAVDARALIRHVRRQMQQSGEGGGTPVTVSASLGTVRGFRGVEMRDVRTELSIRDGGVENLSITGTSDTGMPFSVAIRGQGAGRLRCVGLVVDLLPALGLLAGPLTLCHDTVLADHAQPRGC